MTVTEDDAAADLTTVDPATGETATGVAALWRMLCRVPVLLPMAPLALIGWYVGAAERVYRRMVAAPAP